MLLFTDPQFCAGASASGKLADFDSAIPRFESLRPNHFFIFIPPDFPFLFFLLDRSPRVLRSSFRHPASSQSGPIRKKEKGNQGEHQYVEWLGCKDSKRAKPSRPFGRVFELDAKRRFCEWLGGGATGSCDERLAESLRPNHFSSLRQLLSVY
jgi:hypothetical protein